MVRASLLGKRVRRGREGGGGKYIGSREVEGRGYDWTKVRGRLSSEEETQSYRCEEVIKEA